MQFHIFERAKYHLSVDTGNELTGEHVSALLTVCIYEIDAHSVLTEAVKIFNVLFSAERSENEYSKRLEGRFSSQATKVHSIPETTKLSERFTSLLPFSNSEVNDSQNVPIVAAGAPSNPQFIRSPSDNEYLEAVGKSGSIVSDETL